MLPEPADTSTSIPTSPRDLENSTLIRRLSEISRGGLGIQQSVKEEAMTITDAIERFERGLIGNAASRNTIDTYMRHLRLSAQHAKGKPYC